MVEERAGDSGVTLIETLIVLVLIGVAAGIVTLSLPSGAPPREIAQEAALLSARINLAAEQSLIAARPYRMNWATDGYNFEVWDGEDWGQEGENEVRHELADGILLTEEGGARSGVLRINPDLLPSASGPALFRLRSGTNGQEVLFDGATARPRGDVL
ncbi:MAG: prepilin-type N-terminal cleavage/methylation domain-containing protein [Sulfitobacter sp.]|nr:prepilin-type N-terminal cleavage/methylation domain-containing protein [Sulfitobacter sp.]